MKKGDWLCPNCNFLNFARNWRYLECKVDGPKKLEAATTEMKTGDWICSQCHFMNFARDKMCFKCEESRPKTQLNPGEWECPSCDFRNFRRNRSCLKCNHDRPEDDAQDDQLGCSAQRNTKGADKGRSFDRAGRRDDNDDEVLSYKWRRKDVGDGWAEVRAWKPFPSKDIRGRWDDDKGILPYKGERNHVATKRATPAWRRLTAARCH